ncbi:hypothetical protein EDB80DRAFT_644347 [Ilyonectria destructans]|nr:hypothetical protein EDB80DRAFT_644347 [Ilyonectria destructans]
MCFYEQSLWTCGYWRWGRFREHCPKEHRLGETCGMKLIFETHRLLTACKICENIGLKQRRIKQLLRKMPRLQQLRLVATQERNEEIIAETVTEIRHLRQEHHKGTSGGAGPRRQPPRHDHPSFLAWRPAAQSSRLERRRTHGTLDLLHDDSVQAWNRAATGPSSYGRCT